MASRIYQSPSPINSKKMINSRYFPDNLKPILYHLIASSTYKGKDCIYGFFGHLIFVCSPFYDANKHELKHMLWAQAPSFECMSQKNLSLYDFILNSALKRLIRLFHFPDSKLIISNSDIMSYISYEASKLSAPPTQQSISSFKPTPLPAANRKVVSNQPKPDKTFNASLCLEGKDPKIHAIIKVCIENNEVYNLILTENKDSTSIANIPAIATPILLDEKNNKEIFNAVIHSVKTGVLNFGILVNGRIQRYDILDIVYIDEKYFSSSENSTTLRSTASILPVIVYNGTNGCIRSRHPLQPYSAIVKAKNRQGETTLKVLKCLECNKYFITSQAIKAQGGYKKLGIKLQFDPSCKLSDYEAVGWYDEDTLNGFASSTRFHDDGYTTTKPEYERQRILARFIDSGRHPREECLAYLQKFIASRLYGENATQKAMRDYQFVLNYNSQNDPIIRGELHRNKKRKK